MQPGQTIIRPLNSSSSPMSPQKIITGAGEQCSNATGFGEHVEVPSDLTRVIDKIHTDVLRTKERKSGKSQTAHMAEVANKVIALQGNTLDFLVAYLHDCLEEATDPVMAEQVIRERLARFFQPDVINEVIRRIKLLTEEDVPKEQVNTADGIRTYITQLVPGSTFAPEALEDHVVYVLKYIKYIHTLVAHAIEIRTVTIADKWDGLEDMTYLTKKTQTYKVLSLMRLYATLHAFNAPPHVMQLLRKACAEQGVSFESIQVHNIFMPEEK